MPAAVVRAALPTVRDSEADWLLAVGGGSAIGLAKALALDTGASLAAVPTTYSGSEMTGIYGITDGGQKTTGRSRGARPRLVVYDPELTFGLPLDVTVESAVNAMAHAVEALYAPGIDPQVESMAERSLSALAGALPTIVRHGVGRGVGHGVDSADARAARARALYGAHLAGACLASASMGLHHALCHALGGRVGTRHAASHCVLLPHVLGAQPAVATRALARALGTSPPDDGAGALYDLIASLEGPIALSALGVESADLREIAVAAREARYSAGQDVAVEDIHALLLDAWHGRRPPARSQPAHSRPLHSRRPDDPAPGDDDGGQPEYLSGFAATLQSEALPGALPRTQNSPNPAPYGLFGESVNGTPFTSKRALNQRSWLYRIRPSLLRSPTRPWDHPRFTGRFESFSPVTALTRWKPLPVPAADRAVDFLAGLTTLGGVGDPDTRAGYAIHLYACNQSMDDRCLVDCDGHLLLVPELGRLRIRTEFGWLYLRPGEIAVIPRGLAFSVATSDSGARGYVLEVFGQPFQLPERGPIGANGLADARHFLAPTAAHENRPCDYRVIIKQSGALFVATRTHSPFDVVAWHGNYVPYKYDLALFNTIGSVSFDHADPSVYTVLTCPLDETGAALADFVIFPGRWEVSEHTFRAPYYHRNVATEFSGIVELGAPYAGFERGCYFLTPSHAPHGVSANGYRNAIAADPGPVRMSDESLWIMFESALGIRLSPWAAEADNRDDSYPDIWADMPVRFTGEPVV